MQIAALYRWLLDFEPSPVVEMNASVALAMSGDLSGGLKWLNALERRKSLDRSHLFFAVKGLLLARGGFVSQARRSLMRARRLAKNQREQRYLSRRLAELG